MANVLNLQNVGSIQILEVDANPSLAATTLPNGDPIVPGSIAFADIGGVGKAFIKTALAPDTAWAELDQNNADWSLVGNALTGGTPQTPNEVFGSTNDYDTRWVRNNAEIIRLATEGVLITKGNYGDFATLPAAYRAQSMNLLAVNGGVLESNQFQNGGAGGLPIRHVQAGAGQLTTAGATGTLNLPNIPTQTDTVMQIFSKIIGRQTGGSGGTVGNAFSYTNIATVRNVGGTVTIRQQTATQTWEDDAAATYNMQMTVLGTDVRATVTQPSNRIVKWFGIHECIQVSN